MTCLTARFDDFTEDKHNRGTLEHKSESASVLMFHCKVLLYGQTGFSAPAAKASIMSWATSSWNCTGGDFMK
jgi:hypothetical protein